MKPERREKSYSEKMAAIKGRLADELEDLYTRPDFPSKEYELESVNQLRNGNKIKATRIVIDKLARIANENGVYTIEELRKVYDELLLDWKEITEMKGF